MNGENSDLSDFRDTFCISTGVDGCTASSRNWVEAGAIDQHAGLPIPDLPYKIFDIHTKEVLASGTLDKNGKSPRHHIPVLNTQLFVVFGTDEAIEKAMEQVEDLQTQQALQANAVSEWRGIPSGLDEQSFNQAYDHIAVENGGYEKPSVGFFEGAAYGANMLYNYVSSGFDSDHMLNELYQDDRRRNFEEYQLATNARQATDGESFIGGAGQGLTFGFSEEVMAGLGSLFSQRPYAELVEERRQLQRAQQIANPNWYMGGEITGAIPTIFIPVGGAAANTVRTGQGVNAAIRSGSRTGAVLGGISGAGHDAGNILERLDGAGLGMLTGGIGGAVLSGAGVLIARGVSKTRIWARTNGGTIPQGFTNTQFQNLSKRVKSRAKEMGLGDDILVQGSRASGTARVSSDIDIAIRVSPEKFLSILDDRSIVPNRILDPNPGSAAEKTRNMIIQRGRIHRGEAGLRNLARELEQDLGMNVDISIIRSGGTFDNTPTIQVR